MNLYPGKLNFLFCFRYHDNVLKIYTANEVIVQCNVTELSVAITNTFYLTLLSLCAVYTFKTRKLPKQFRETKGLALAIYLAATIHLIVLSIVCTMDNQSLIRGRLVILSHPLAASAVLFPLYLPKLYSVAFREEKKIVHRMARKKASAGNDDNDGVALRMSQSTPDLLRRRLETDTGNNRHLGVPAEGLIRNHAESLATLSDDSRSPATSTDTLPSNRCFSTGEISRRGEERDTDSSYADNRSSYSVYSTWL